MNSALYQKILKKEELLPPPSPYQLSPLTAKAFWEAGFLHPVALKRISSVLWITLNLCTFRVKREKNCIEACALLSVTHTQQVPLLQQKREKENEGGCELQSKRDLRSASARGRGVLLSTLHTEGLRSAQRQRLGRGSCVGVTLRRLCRLETGESTDTVDPGGSGKKLLKKETEKRKG
ncbi:hypothetical protein CRENBAI_024276 [Crenichthys baileyi]|uniref:Uncharacterized protein n=1 Tax=Crenichthys baileyi TaxID=28760 RepID=A0AAV9SQI3_9TELE